MIHSDLSPKQIKHETEKKTVSGLSQSGGECPVMSYPVSCFRGAASVPGDKSVSIRFFILAALAHGVSEAIGVLESEDSLNTVEALRKLGVRISKTQQKDEASPIWSVNGMGKTGLKPSGQTLDLGNSGTGCRLLMGVLAQQDFSTELTGDQSLQKRPMARILNPLSKMGCHATSQPKGRLPVKLFGRSDLKPLNYCLPVPSAQLKSAILLAGLAVKGSVLIEEPIACRTHTETMLRFFGAEISVQNFPAHSSVSESETKNKRRASNPKEPSLLNVSKKIVLKGPARLQGRGLAVPSDPSSAAFLIIAALLIKNSELKLNSLLKAPERTGFIDVLQAMQADIKLSPGMSENQGKPYVEKTFDIWAKTSRLKAVHIDHSKAPSLIDEFPILSVAASFAEGVSRFDGMGELRFKESDRFEAIITLLKNSGVNVKTDQDTLMIEGCFPDKPFGKAHCLTQYDHRLAMSALVMGAAAQNPVSIDNSQCIATSFPDFLQIMNRLGADLRPLKPLQTG